MKIFFSLLVMVVWINSLLFAQKDSSKHYSPSTYGKASSSSQALYFHNLNQEAHLSKQEQQFAAQLSPTHRTVFSTIFSRAQRIEAMTLEMSQATDLNRDKMIISSDEAVELVMQNARSNGSNHSNVTEQPRYFYRQEESSKQRSDYYYPPRSSPKNKYGNNE